MKPTIAQMRKKEAAMDRKGGPKSAKEKALERRIGEKK